MSPNLECLCRAVVRSAAGEFKSFAVHKFHSCNGILAGRITGAPMFFFAIHFINKCFANQNVCKRTEDHKWTMQTFCHFDVIVAQKKMFASNVCLPWPPLLSRMLLAQRNPYELVRISGQQPNIKQGRSLCRHQMRPRNAPSEDNKTFFLKWNVCKHFCIAPVLPNKMGGRGPIWISN